MKEQTTRAASVAPATDHHEALAQLREAYQSGRAGPQGLIALSNQYPGITIAQISAILREVQTERQASK